MYSAVLVVPETFDNRGKYVVSFSFFFFFFVIYLESQIVILSSFGKVHALGIMVSMSA